MNLDEDGKKWLESLSKEDLIIHYLSLTPIYITNAIELVQNGYSMGMVDFDDIIRHRHNLFKLYKDDNVYKKDAELSKYKNALNIHYKMISQYIPIITKEGDNHGYTISSHQEWEENGKSNDLQALR